MNKPGEREPDKLRFESHGLTCCLCQWPWQDEWCGYVGVNAQHPLYGVGHCLPSACLKGATPEDTFCVHGEITFSGRHKYIDTPLWLFGFDCCHGDDYTKEAAKAETEKMAKQLAEVGQRASITGDKT